jgi:hypothetical protein
MAHDMTFAGPKYDAFRYSLMYNMQNTPTPLDSYPSGGTSFPEE